MEGALQRGESQKLQTVPEQLALFRLLKEKRMQQLGVGLFRLSSTVHPFGMVFYDCARKCKGENLACSFSSRSSQKSILKSLKLHFAYMLHSISDSVFY